MRSVREAAQQHADARGLRAVAREIGISGGALKNFLAGSAPYTRTAAALRAWFSEQAEVGVPRIQEPRRSILHGIGHEALREALRRATAEKTLRDVAAQVGMTHVGLQRYIQGKTRPREFTQRKLREWYLREAENWTGVDVELARAAMGVLLDGLPLRYQRGAEAECAELVRRCFERARLSPPQWIAKIEGLEQSLTPDPPT